jgi:hypothetical protein
MAQAVSTAVRMIFFMVGVPARFIRESRARAAADHGQ